MCSFKQGFSHWSRLGEREKHLFTSQLLWPPSFLAVFCSLFVTPKRHARSPEPGHLLGVSQSCGPGGQRSCHLLREIINPWGLAEGAAAPPFPTPGQSCLPRVPFSRQEGTARWEMGRKGKTRMWLAEANKKMNQHKARRQTGAGRDGGCLVEAQRV